MTRVIHIAEMRTGEDTVTVLGAFDTLEAAEALVQDYKSALASAQEYLTAEDVNITGLHDASNATVFTYSVEVGSKTKAPVLGFMAYDPRQVPVGENRYGAISTTYFNPVTGEDLLGSLPISQIPPSEVVQAASQNPDKVHRYSSQAFSYQRDPETQEAYVKSVEVDMYLSLSLEALRAQILPPTTEG